MIDYGRLTAGRKKLYAIPLPSGNKSIIVRYDTGVKVSCIMPPAKRTVYVSDGTICPDDWEYDGYKTEMEAIKSAYTPVTIDCPSLIYSVYYRDRPTYGFVRRLVDSHYIYCFNDEVNTHIEAAPYMLSNVYRGGSICFGSLNMPESPRHGFVQFWSSPFNGELMGEAEGSEDYSYVEEYIADYHKEVLAAAPWEDLTDVICGRKFWASPTGADGVLVTDRKELVEKIPKKHWRKAEDGIPFIVAQAHQQADKSWKFISGDFTFSLSENSVRCVEKVSRRVSAAKSKYAKLETGSVDT